LKSTRFKITPRENASKGHIYLGESLKELFPLNKIFQEYPYDKIIRKGYKLYNVPEDCWDHALLKRATRFHADWVVLDLCLIFEWQGEHHFSPIYYNSELEKADAAYAARVIVDKKKRYMAQEARFKLLEIPYYYLNKLDNNVLLDLINGVKE